jgi:2-polyprenyl-6-hydroxyphenyl methylase/3-demethylubiquinone-9 3-methyltransferase
MTMTESATRNADAAEVARFNAMASRWWDPDGEMRLLHRMNPVRAAYIAGRAPLAGRRCLDVGCGAGLLTEALAREGAEVTGVDLAEDSLAVARLHLSESGLPGIRYCLTSAEELAEREPAAFDVITCLEVLEHLPDPASTIGACARLLRPGGDVFFSTLNRTPRAWLVAILGAEYLLGAVPRGTHRHGSFIRPSELDAWARRAALELQHIAGLQFDVLAGRFSLGRDVGVNYLVHYRKAGPA